VSQLETRSTMTNTGSCTYQRQHCTNADASTDQPQIHRAPPIRHLMLTQAHHHHAHMLTPHACIHAHMQIQRLKCIHAHHTHHSSKTHRRVAPVNRLVFVHRTRAGVKGRQRQLYSARRQTTVHSEIGQRLEAIVIPQTILSPPAGPFIPRLNDTGTIETVLQGTGPAASATRTRTHARGLSGCVSRSLYVMHLQ
jgi:hypothetical protein